MQAVLQWLDASAVSQALSASIWIYPLINAGHILGLALLIGAIVPLDLRMLGAWAHVDPGDLNSVLTPVALTGLITALICGFLLFSTQPQDYSRSTLFVSKMLLLLTAVANALWTRRSRAWKHWLQHSNTSLALRCHAFVSLLIWPLVALLGRLIGYR
jgi:hypothetical protein